MSGPETEVVVREFVDLWAQSLSQMLAKVAATPFPIEMRVGEPTPLDGGLYIIVSTAGAIRGEMCLRIPFDTATELLKIFLTNAAFSHTELTPDDRSALEELFRQVAGHVSTSAREHWKEVLITLQSGDPPTWSAGATGLIRFAPQAPHKINIEWQISAALAASLQAAWTASADTQSADAQAIPDAFPGSGPLGMLLDLELDLSLRFGSRNISLKEILDLGPGSVLELDREIQDPADLILDGRLIAQGEVVVVDGNFGLRVTEVFTNSQT